MTDDAAELTPLTPVQLPARDIAPPSTISAEARAALAAGAALPVASRPDPSDLDAWRRAVAASEAMWEPIAAQMLSACRARVETRTIAGVTCHVSTPPGLTEAQASRLYVYLHGGALVFGGGAYAKAHGAATADRIGVTTVSVDYRMPPDHPFPAAPEDCVAVYRELIETHDPAHVVIGGSSAGGNLAAAAALMIRDRGLPSPAAVILLTPEVDLTEAGDTFQTNVLLDVQLKGGLPECNALYAAGHDLADPYLSPLFGGLRQGVPADPDPVRHARPVPVQLRADASQAAQGGDRGRAARLGSHAARRLRHGRGPREPRDRRGGAAVHRPPRLIPLIPKAYLNSDRSMESAIAL